MIAQDAVVLGIGGVLISGVAAILGSVLSKRMSSTSEDQTALNDSFRIFMESQDQKYDDLEAKHEHCETRVSILQGIVRKLVRALRDKVIPLPEFTFPEQMLMLEDLTLVDKGDIDGRIPPTPRVPSSE